ncbi:MAG: efflux RND transporter periplasmic adaptor subunit [Candidatus Omnitrophica bacterium]|nr:efflux RND transporter periplasmic adaptor subunit [Candidatus Omnitrophota bacterium]
MTKNKKWPIYFFIVVVIVIAVFILKSRQKSSDETVQEIEPVIGAIQMSITSTATVQPQNRLEIKPPINGRIDKILVKEGERVKAGQTLALMSSTERAALLDAARARGPEEMKYWEDVYKATPLITPIDGEVIVSTDEPGQTVTSSDVVVVLSDYLIVQAQVDETDIGKVKFGQRAGITLDAYPEIKIAGKVDHIYYESEVVNNVTIYKVDILPDSVPDVFRSGMSATVAIVEKAKDNILILPLSAIKRDEEGPYVLVRGEKTQEVEERRIQTGISDEKNIEIISGLTASDKVWIVTQKYKANIAKTGTNPLMPVPRRKK